MSAPLRDFYGNPRFVRDSRIAAAQPVGSPEVSGNPFARSQTPQIAAGRPLKGGEMPDGTAPRLETKDDVIARLQLLVLRMVERGSRPGGLRHEELHAAEREVWATAGHGALFVEPAPWEVTR